ncbi:MAG: type II toxin-antitoxin system RelE/ParE family toxin [Candidatus Binataceae bacterium]
MLDAQGDYIANDDPAAATRIVNLVLDGVERLAAFPVSGRPGRVPGTRELVVPGTPFIVPYRVVGQSVEILAVLHTSTRNGRRSALETSRRVAFTAGLLR